jgi:lysozyme
MAINPKVVDLYHGDDLVYTDEDHDFQAVFNSGIRGIIHKATEGPSMVDAKFRQREIAARSTELLWGWYHFMRPGDPAKQAEHFFTTIGGHTRGPGVLVLDHEDPSVGVGAALRWMEVIRLISGQTPWIYSGFLIRQQMDNRHKPEWAEFPLWLPEYGPVAKVPLPWQKYTLWQFTGDGEGPLPHSVPGIAHAVCDISSFDGTDEELRTVWLGEEKVA